MNFNNDDPRCSKNSKCKCCKGWKQSYDLALKKLQALKDLGKLVHLKCLNKSKGYCCFKVHLPESVSKWFSNSVNQHLTTASLIHIIYNVLEWTRET
jgi:hypothetical protein